MGLRRFRALLLVLTMAIQAASAGNAVAAMASELDVASIHCLTSDTQKDARRRQRQIIGGTTVFTV